MKKEIFFNFIFTFLAGLIIFIQNKFFVKYMGIEILGIMNLFTQLLQYLNIVELGLGSASAFALYKPLAENDTKKLTQLMTLFKKAYRTIAFAMFLIGLCLLPRIDLFVSKIDVSLNYLRLIYFLFLIKTACSYLLSYKISLINADQKAYIVSICNLFTKIIFTIIEIVILLIFHNFILYLILEILLVLITNFILSQITDRKYPFLKNEDQLPKGESKNIFNNIKNIFITTICTRITSSTDNILISMLVGTIQVGIYSQYSMIINGINTLVRQMNTSISASIGNFMMTEKKSKCHEIMCNMTFINFIIGSICSCCLLSLLNPFISIVFGKEYLIDNLTLYVICYNFFLATICHCIWIFTNVSGLFEKDKNIGVIGTIFNLFVSIILGKTCGMVGIFFGTSLTHFIQGELKIRLLYNQNFNLNPKSYSNKWWRYMILTSIEMFICFMIYLHLPIKNLYLQFLIMLVISILIPSIINLCLFYKTNEFKYLTFYVNNLIKKIKMRNEI